MINRLTAIVALIGSTIWASDPAQAVTQALEWSKANPAANVRFLSLGNVPEEERARAVKTLLLTVNSLNLQNRMANLIHCSPELVAVDLAVPGWDYQAWEALGRRNSYFRGPWIEASPEFGQLRVVTGSAYPIIRADEFVAKATVAPAYYDFLFGVGKVKTRAELHQVLGVDDRFAKMKIAGIKVFGLSVTRNPRILSFRMAPFPLWTSDDFDSPIGDSNPLEKPDTSPGPEDDPKIAGQEHIFRLRNGLIGSYLNDPTGKRVDEVPTTIAHGETNFPDRRVRVGRSCIGCHETGIKSFTSDENILRQSNINQLTAVTKELQEAFENKYDAQAVQFMIEDGQTGYDRAVFSLTGDECEKVAQGYVQDWIQYEEEGVGLSEAARESNMSEKDCEAVLSSINKPYALALVNHGDIKRKIPRAAWEEIYPQLMFAVKFPNQVINLPKTAQIKLESAAETYSSDRMDLVEVGKPDANWNYTVTLKPDADGVYPGWVELKLKGGKTVRHEVLK